MADQQPFELRTAHAIVNHEDEIARRIAAERGPAPGSRKVSAKREQLLWYQVDPNVDAVAMVQQAIQQATQQAAMAVQQGMPADQAASEREKMIWQSVEQASMAKYPHRKDLLELGHVTLAEQVKYAERMNKTSESLPEGADDNGGPPNGLYNG